VTADEKKKSLVKKGIVSIEVGRAVNKAFDLRQRGDYRETDSITYEQVEPFLEQAKLFINSVRGYLRKPDRL
jgi:uncharacterized protein (UPF0332 family)